MNHCVKSVRIRSYSGLHFSRIFPHSNWIRRDTEYLSVFSPNAGKCGKNVDQNKSEYGHFLSNERDVFYRLFEGRKQDYVSLLQDFVSKAMLSTPNYFVLWFRDSNVWKFVRLCIFCITLKMLHNKLRTRCWSEALGCMKSLRRAHFAFKREKTLDLQIFNRTQNN